jgi:hypothetical protein
MNPFGNNMTAWWVTAILVAMLPGMAWAGASMAIGPTQDVVAQQDFPWYSPDGQVVGITPRTSDWDASSLRNSVAAYRAPAATSSNWNWNWNWSGSWWKWLLYLIGIVLALGIGLILYRLFVLSRDVESEARLRAGRVTDFSKQIKDLPFQLDAPTGDCRSLADQARLAGNYSRAIVFLFSHVLLYLDDLHVLRLQRGKTNRQYLRETARIEAARSYLGSLIAPFESVFFGDHSIEATEFDSYWNALPAFEAQVERQVGSAAQR